MWSFLKLKVLLISFILNTFVQQTSSANSMCEYNFESVEVVNGQCVSVRFHLNGPLLENQTFMWVAPHTSWIMNCNSSLQCTSNESSIRTRYKLTQLFQNYTFEVLIRPAQDEDSGQHFIFLYEGANNKCTALILYLTVVESSNSTCITRLDRKKGKIQLSCQWTQVSNNEHAELLAGNNLVFEDRAPNHMLDDNFILTHEFSVYIDIEALVHIDYVCVVFQGRSIVRNACHFPTPQRHLVKSNQSEERQLNCCVTNENTSVTWWNNASGDELPYSVQTMNYTILFLCLEKNDSHKAKINMIGILDLTEFEGRHTLTLAESSSKSKHPIDSTDKLRCETLSVNITLGLRPTTDGSTEGNSILSTNNLNQSKQPTIQSNNTDHVMLVSVAAVVLMCLVFSIAINIFVLCYYNFLRKDTYHVSEQSSTDAPTSLAAEEDNVDDSRSHEMTTFSRHPPRPSTDTNVPSATIETSLLDREAVESSYEDRAYPQTLQVLCDMEESFPAKSISTCNISIVDEFVQGEGAGDGSNDESNGKRVVDHPVSMTPDIDSAYSSVADVKGATRFTEKANLSPILSTFLCPLQSSEDHDGVGLDVTKIETYKTRSSRGDFVIRSTNRPAAELEVMYAQPDMTRKTKNMGKLSHQSVPQSSQNPHRVPDQLCGKGPCDPTGEVRQNNISPLDPFYSLVPTDGHTGHLYGDDDVDRITESTCGAELYMNSCVHRFE